jgi:glutamyl/glutaminyl-tRNA synthetase
MIEMGLAYADDTPADKMKEERDAGIESVHRNATVQENLERFQYMLDTRKREEEAKKAKAKPKEAKKPKAVVDKVAKGEEVKQSHMDIKHVDSAIIDPVIAETHAQDKQGPIEKKL